MDDELMRALGRLRREELASSDAVGSGIVAPLSEPERVQVLDGLFDRLDGGPATHGHPNPPVPILRPPRGRLAAVIAGALAVAAALVLLWARPRGGADMGLPPYAVTRAQGGAATVRSAPVGGRLELREPSDAVDVVVTPATPSRDAVDVVLVAHPVSGSGMARLEAVTDRVERSDDGALRLRGALDGFIALTPGGWQLDVVVCPAGQAPSSVDAARDGACRAMTLEVMIAAP